MIFSQVEVPCWCCGGGCERWQNELLFPTQPLMKAIESIMCAEQKMQDSENVDDDPGVWSNAGSKQFLETNQNKSEEFLQNITASSNHGKMFKLCRRMHTCKSFHLLLYLTAFK